MRRAMATKDTLILPHPPIVEAVLDIECDLPPAFDLKAMEAAAHAAFGGRYPKSRFQVLHEHQIEPQGDSALKVSARQGLQALQFLTDDEKQVVQVRAQGFSFNRLAPYTTLDDYLPEIQSNWELYRGVAGPLQVRMVRLRYINRILLPLKNGRIRFTEYLALGSQLREPEGLSFRGFLNQHAGVEESTGNEVNIVLATQPGDALHQPVILDITALKPGALEADGWGSIATRIQSLRHLKNHVFRSTLTRRCLSLFQ